MRQIGKFKLLEASGDRGMWVRFIRSKKPFLLLEQRGRSSF